jgi:hypothetical protein
MDKRSLHLNAKNQVIEVRTSETYGYRGDFGRASIMIICPFCKAHLRGYIWSLAGGGKKCSCGALHGTNRAYKEIKELPGKVGEAMDYEIGFYGRWPLKIDGIKTPAWLTVQIIKEERSSTIHLFGSPDEADKQALEMDLSTENQKYKIRLWVVTEAAKIKTNG